VDQQKHCVRFIVAVMAQSYSTSPDAEERTSGMQLGRASYRVSTAGIIVGIIILILIFVTRSTQKSNYD